MNKEFWKREILIWIVLLLPNIYFLIVYGQLPEELPIHWNIHGEADDYGPKYVLPLIHVSVYFLLLILPKIDPRKKNYDIFSKTYFKLRFAIVLFFGALNSVVFTSELGYEFDLARIVVMGVLLLFVVLGNYMGNIRPNWFIGIRNPWTLENEEVWRKTHVLGGKLFFWIGLVTFILSFFLQGKIFFPLVGIVLLMIVLITMLYSFLLYRKIERNEKPENQGSTSK